MNAAEFEPGVRVTDNRLRMKRFLQRKDKRVICGTRRNRLAAREKEILSWLAKGKSAHETGIILNISVCTVRIHIQNIKRKLDASNIPHAIAKAFDERILEPSPNSSRTEGGLFMPAAEVKKFATNYRR